MFVCTNTQLNTAALRTCWGVYLQNSICLCNFLNLDRYCFKYVVTHCLLHISYLGNSAEKTTFLRQESRKVERGISAPAGVTCSLRCASFSKKLLCTGLSLHFSMQEGFCVAAEPGPVSTFLTILSKRASFHQIAET